MQITSARQMRLFESNPDSAEEKAQLHRTDCHGVSVCLCCKEHLFPERNPRLFCQYKWWSRLRLMTNDSNLTVELAANIMQKRFVRSNDQPDLWEGHIQPLAAKNLRLKSLPILISFDISRDCIIWFVIWILLDLRNLMHWDLMLRVLFLLAAFGPMHGWQKNL